MHPARILLHASLAVLEAFKLEGRLVVLATFGGPMHSKVRLFVGSVLLFALSACGQGAPTAPVSTVAAPATLPEGSAAGSGIGAVPDVERQVCGDGKMDDPTHYQIGDGIYAVRYLKSDVSPAPLVGFSWVKNRASCPRPLPGTQNQPGSPATVPSECEVANWMILKQLANQNADFPINSNNESLVFCFVHAMPENQGVDKFRALAFKFALAELPRVQLGDFRYGITATFSATCDGSADPGCK